MAACEARETLDIRVRTLTLSGHLTIGWRTLPGLSLLSLLPQTVRRMQLPDA
jgi:hypothetical protein